MNLDMDDPQMTEVQQLRAEVAGLRFAVKLTWCLLIAGLGVFGYLVVGCVPALGNIMVDLVGDRNKLPYLTMVVIAWSSHGGGLAALALTAFGLMLPWLFKSLRVAGIVAAVCAFLLLGHALICWLAMMLPLITVFGSIASGS